MTNKEVLQNFVKSLNKKFLAADRDKSKDFQLNIDESVPDQLSVELISPRGHAICREEMKGALDQTAVDFVFERMLLQVMLFGVMPRKELPFIPLPDPECKDVFLQGTLSGGMIYVKMWEVGGYNAQTKESSHELIVQYRYRDEEESHMARIPLADTE